MCAATLVRASSKSDESDIVITAAHCAQGASPQLEILAGAHSLADTKTGQQRVTVKKVMVHPRYGSETGANDIAIVKLAKPIKFSSQIQPACLPAPTDTLSDTTPAVAVGWGALARAPSLPGLLMQVPALSLNLSECAPRLGPRVPQNSMFCVKMPERVEDCAGDNGTPLLTQSATGFVLTGVASSGAACAGADKPGIYTRVSNYRQWINSQIAAMTSVK
jgi:transmembrane serine protease 3